MAIISSFRGLGAAVVLFLTIVSAAQAKYSGGTGEPNDPYRIATAEDLMLLGESPDDYGKHFILTADIDLDPNLPDGRIFDRAPIAPSAETVNPYDDFKGVAFSGVFDGDSHVISNLVIRGVSHLGLFGLISGRVWNVELAGARITGSGYNIGPLMGSNCGSVTQCHSTGTVIGDSHVGGLVGQNIAGRITRCHSDAAVIAAGNSVGGLVGHANGGSIFMSYSTGLVAGQSYVGGLVGRNYEGAVSCCYSVSGVSGAMHIGGLIGQNWTGYVTHCYSVGAVNGESTFGGFIGSNVDTGRSPGVVIGCFWDIEKSGQPASIRGKGITTAQMQEISTFLAAGWDFVDESSNGTCDYWQMPPGEYPRLLYCAGDSPVMPEGLGTAEQPYLIRDARDLGTVWFEPAAYYRLEASVDLSGTTWAMAVVPWFEGTFDGNDHVISNLHIQGNGYLGLFGQSGPGAAIRSLGLESVDVNGTSNSVGGLVGDNDGSIADTYSTGVVFGDGCVGGLAGNNDGSIAGSYCTSTVCGDSYKVGGLVGDNSFSITTSYSTGSVTGSGHIGGLVGINNDGNISASFSTGKVNGTGSYVGGLIGYHSGSIAKSRSSSTVNGGNHVGGLVGCNSGSVAMSYSSGIVSGGDLVGGFVGFNTGDITTSHSDGAVTGDWRVGGLAGLSDGSIATSYSTGAVRGQREVGGLVGHKANAFVGHSVLGSIAMCYSIGAVSGGSSIGGLVGAGDPNGVTASFWDTEASRQATSLAGVGKTTAEMQTASTFLDAGWDFVDETANGTDDIWWILEGKDYPRLWWEDE
jgi:hypothetical protein